MILQEVISSPLISEEATGSPAIRLGDFIFMTALDASMLSGYDPSVSAKEQTERTLHLMDLLLKETNNRSDSVIRLDVCLTDRSDIPDVREVLLNHFGDVKPLVSMTGAAFLEHDAKVSVSVQAVDTYGIMQQTARQMQDAGGCEGCTKKR
ncbi:MAG: Rid family hydrolase [Erysipelotrichaceae bacterium]|nr:Rid family hydrolase [Erysipelotrichaceae bacterium]